MSLYCNFGFLIDLQYLDTWFLCRFVVFRVWTKDSQYAHLRKERSTLPHPAFQDEKSDLVNRAVARRLTLCQRMGLKVVVGDLAILSCRNVFENKQQITTITLRLLLWKMVWYWDLMMSEPWNQEMTPQKGLGSKDLCSSTNCRTFDPNIMEGACEPSMLQKCRCQTGSLSTGMVVFQPLHVNFVRGFASSSSVPGDSRFLFSKQLGDVLLWLIICMAPKRRLSSIIV